MTPSRHVRGSKGLEEGRAEPRQLSSPMILDLSQGRKKPSSGTSFST
jgi:hypothetical protein